MARQETTDPEQSITQNGNTPSGVSHDRATEQHERATAHSLRQAILQNTQSQAVNSHPADMVLTNIFTFVQHLSNFIPAQQFHAGLFNLFVSVRNLASQFIPAPQLNQFLLDCAVTRGDAASIKMLCSEANSLSLDPNAFVGNTTVPLLYNLVALSKDDAVKALLQHPHIDPNLHNSNCGLVPLHQAVCNGDSGSFETLLNHQKIDINAESSQGKTTALHFAARQGKIDFVKELLQKENINVNKPAVGGITALSQALISPNEREDVRIQLVTTLLQDPRTDPNSAIGLIEQKHSHADQLTDFYLKTRMAKTLEELDSLDSKAKKIIMLEDWANFQEGFSFTDPEQKQAQENASLRWKSRTNLALGNLLAETQNTDEAINRLSLALGQSLQSPDPDVRGPIFATALLDIIDQKNKNRLGYD